MASNLYDDLFEVQVQRAFKRMKVSSKPTKMRYVPQRERLISRNHVFRERLTHILLFASAHLPPSHLASRAQLSTAHGSPCLHICHRHLPRHNHYR